MESGAAGSSVSIRKGPAQAAVVPRRARRRGRARARQRRLDPLPARERRAARRGRGARPDAERATGNGAAPKAADRHSVSVLGSVLGSTHRWRPRPHAPKCPLAPLKIPQKSHKVPPNPKIRAHLGFARHFLALLPKSPLSMCHIKNTKRVDAPRAKCAHTQKKPADWRAKSL